MLKRIIVILVSFLILIGISLVMVLEFRPEKMLNKDNIVIPDISLEQGYIELNRENVFYPEGKDVLEISAVNDLVNIQVNENQLNILFNGNSYQKEFPTTIKSIGSYKYCGDDELFPYLYVLTVDNKVYRSSLLDINNLPLLLMGEYEEIQSYDLVKNVSFLNLNSQVGFSTCYSADVFLKVDNHVYTMDRKEYTDVYFQRKVSPTVNGLFTYYYDGTISLDDTYVTNNQGEKISFIFIGKYNNQNYLLDKYGNEYIFEEDITAKILQDSVFIPVDSKGILKIGVKDKMQGEMDGESVYQIVFTDKTRKNITSLYNENVFSVVKSY